MSAASFGQCRWSRIQRCTRLPPARSVPLSLSQRKAHRLFPPMCPSLLRQPMRSYLTTFPAVPTFGRRDCELAAEGTDRSAGHLDKLSQLVRRRASSGSRRTSAGWWTRRTQGEHERHQERAPRGRPTEGSERESVSHCARPGNRRSTVQRCGVCSQSPRQPGSARFHGAPIEELVSIGPQSTASNLRPPTRTGAISTWFVL